jgi:hypothetical protein
MKGCRIVMLEVGQLSRPLAACMVLGMTCACGAEPEPVKKPQAPDMSELVAAYEAPTAELNRETAAQVLESVDALLAQLDSLGLQEQLLGTIDTTIDEQIEQNEASGETSSALGVEQGGPLGKLQQRAVKGDAYLTVTRICGGFGPEPVPDPMNGKITLTVGLTDDVLDSVMWGSFDACKYALAGAEIELSGIEPGKPGSYSVYVGNELRLRDFALSQVLFQVSLLGSLDGNEQPLEADFRVDVESLALDLRIPVEGGYVLAHADSALVGVSATNGDFECDAMARTCSAGDEQIEF